MIKYNPMKMVEFNLSVMKTHEAGTMPNHYHVKLSYKGYSIEDFVSSEDKIPEILPRLYSNLLASHKLNK